MRNPLLALLLLALACGDDSSSCELPPGRYSVHAFDPSGQQPDRDFVQLNQAPLDCHGSASITGALVDLDCTEVSAGQFFCSGEVLTAGARFELSMRGPI